MQEENLNSLAKAFRKEISSQDEAVEQLRSRIDLEKGEKMKMEEERVQRHF